MNTLFATTGFFAPVDRAEIGRFESVFDQVWFDYAARVDLLATDVILAPDVAAALRAVTYVQDENLVEMAETQGDFIVFEDTFETDLIETLSRQTSAVETAAVPRDLTMIGELFAAEADIDADLADPAPTLEESLSLTAIVSEDGDTDVALLPQPGVEQALAVQTLDVYYLADPMTGFEYAAIDSGDGLDGL